LLDDVVFVVIDMSFNDLLIINEVARRLGISRNEAIKYLIRKGFEYITKEGGGEKR